MAITVVEQMDNKKELLLASEGLDPFGAGPFLKDLTSERDTSAEASRRQRANISFLGPP